MSDLLTLQAQNTFEPLIVLAAPALRHCSLTQHNSDDQVLGEVKCALTLCPKSQMLSSSALGCKAAVSP